SFTAREQAGEARQSDAAEHPLQQADPLFLLLLAARRLHIIVLAAIEGAADLAPRGGDIAAEGDVADQRNPEGEEEQSEGGDGRAENDGEMQLAAGQTDADVREETDQPALIIGA